MADSKVQGLIRSRVLLYVPVQAKGLLKFLFPFRPRLKSTRRNKMPKPNPDEPEPNKEKLREA